MARETGYVHVVANLEFLDLTALLLDEFLDDKAADGVAGVALTRVRLDDDTAVHPRRMVLLVLRAVVRVDGVADIGADQEGPGNGLSERLRVGRESVQKVRDERRLGTGGRDGADLFMVEEGNDVNVAFESREEVGGRYVRESFYCGKPKTT